MFLCPEVGLQSARIVPGIGQRLAAAMAQHVRMDRKWHLRPGPDPAEQHMKRLRRHRSGAAIRRPISASVRYSRVRTEYSRVRTEEFTVVGVMPLIASF